MNLEDAWNVLGRDPAEVVASIRACPVPERAEAAGKELEKAKALARRLMGLHHPDKNPGDAEAAMRFRRVADALKVVERKTAELRERLAARPEEPRAVFIEVERKP